MSSMPMELPKGNQAGVTQELLDPIETSPLDFVISSGASGQVIEMLIESAIPDISTKEFNIRLFDWAVMFAVCVISLSIAILDLLKIIDLLHPVVWFTFSGGSAVLSATHFMRLKELWQTK